MRRYWYSYVLPAGDPRLASSYQFLGINQRPRCFTGTRLCAIYSTAGGPFPFSPLSTNMQEYIARALANGLPQPETPFGSRLFVYLKA